MKLMNSAMMPCEGMFISKKISIDEFAEELFTNQNCIENYIGYQDTLDFIEKEFGQKFNVNRNLTVLEDIDTILVIKLRYRVHDPNMKGKFVPKKKDYEYFKIEYRRFV